MIKYDTYKASRIGKRDLIVLGRLGNEGNSSMGIFLRNRGKYKWGGRVFIARTYGRHIVGWALYLGYRVRGGAQIHVYVDPIYRRLGIGRELCIRAKGHGERVGGV